MKINKVKSRQILLLYLLKSKIYEQVIKKNISNFLVKSCLTELLINFKKSLQIIFSYHVKNRSILFVGLPYDLSSRINKTTIHISLSKYCNLKGNILGISKRTIINSKKNIDVNNKASILKSRRKPCLIVIVDHLNLDEIVKESYSNKIPLILVSSDFDKKNFFYKNLHKISINHKLLNPLKNFFFVGLSFLFK